MPSGPSPPRLLLFPELLAQGMAAVAPIHRSKAQEPIKEGEGLSGKVGGNSRWWFCPVVNQTRFAESVTVTRESPGFSLVLSPHLWWGKVLGEPSLNHLE